MALGFLAIAALAACSGKTTKIDFTMRRDAVLDEVQKNTRTVKVYRDLDTIFIADVLWYTPKLRRNFIANLKSEGRINDQQVAKMNAEVAEKEGSGGSLEFITGFYTPDKTWNDLEKTNSMWSLTIKGSDGTAVSPVKVEKLKYDKMQDSWLFPFLTPWKNAYRVTFTGSGALMGMDSYTLRVSSTVGEGTFTWDAPK